MALDLTITRLPAYVRYTAAGANSLLHLADVLGRVAVDLRQHPQDRVLLDLRLVEGRLSTQEQQQIGAIGATGLPKEIRLASIVPAGEITRNSERSATSMGRDVRVFDSESSALAWLLA